MMGSEFCQRSIKCFFFSRKKNFARDAPAQLDEIDSFWTFNVEVAQACVLGEKYGRRRTQARPRRRNPLLTAWPAMVKHEALLALLGHTGALICKDNDAGAGFKVGERVDFLVDYEKALLQRIAIAGHTYVCLDRFVRAVREDGTWRDGTPVTEGLYLRALCTGLDEVRRPAITLPARVTCVQNGFCAIYFAAGSGTVLTCGRAASRVQSAP